MATKNTYTITLEEVIANSIRIRPGMIAVYPQFQAEEPVSVSGLAPKFNGFYSTNNSTVCFVYDDKVYVTPRTREAIHALQKEGFDKRDFFVPFSNGDYPKNEKFQWDRIQRRANIVRKAEFVEDCIAFCEEKGIGSISEEALNRCFEMPSDGVRIKQFYYEDCYYPIINGGYLDSFASGRIGKFCANNGKVVFVYRDGKTYVTKGYAICKELRANGYTEAGLFVPFSNGETIVDEHLRRIWDSIK